MPDVEKIYSEFTQRIGGADMWRILSDSSSFVAKVILMELYRKFSSFILNDT